ncbi:hypothetical protein [Bradyrhizobium valentinum]|uniref:Uncharacterized protein n=1 Tax=Bradyrhizobium valentinum TaxID=1518501 RepID=A0A0R3L020_9BRAD|nr:hypothetical protein [Bradyrhizobium valentinum]KRQ99244.1 hypothetical protein CP49_11645 [Bradyrhizobium valentinum]
MNLTNEISALESQVQMLLAENESFRHTLSVMEFEREQLTRRCSTLQRERDNYMRRAEQIKILLDQTGANLVTGLHKYHAAERELAERDAIRLDELPAPSAPPADERGRYRGLDPIDYGEAKDGALEPQPHA